uniref:Fe2OG dioxygenase domain-containing protein n=1 Tax=Dunaliella viridis TaxID=140095 RepID=C8XTB3_9CHLO|nr:hypothetical protein [Dunaliella viridis]
MSTEQNPFTADEQPLQCSANPFEDADTQHSMLHTAASVGSGGNPFATEDDTPPPSHIQTHSFDPFATAGQQASTGSTATPSASAAAAGPGSTGSISAAEAWGTDAPSQGLHQNLESLLKASHQGLHGQGWASSEEATELAKIRRQRENWEGLVAPKPQHCTPEGGEARSSMEGGSRSQRTVPLQKCTSLELRMAAAEAVHVARTASPAHECLYGRQHSRPTSNSPKLSFLGQDAGLPQASLAAAFQLGSSPGAEGLGASDAGRSSLELRMAAAEAMAVTQRAAWEQQQQQQQQQEVQEQERQRRDALYSSHPCAQSPPRWPARAAPPPPVQVTPGMLPQQAPVTSPLSAAPAAQPKRAPPAVPAPPPPAPTAAAGKAAQQQATQQATHQAPPNNAFGGTASSGRHTQQAAAQHAVAQQAAQQAAQQEWPSDASPFAEPAPLPVHATPSPPPPPSTTNTNTNTTNNNIQLPHQQHAPPQVQQPGVAASRPSSSTTASSSSQMPAQPLPDSPPGRPEGSGSSSRGAAAAQKQALKDERRQQKQQLLPVHESSSPALKDERRQQKQQLLPVHESSSPRAQRDSRRSSSSAFARRPAPPPPPVLQQQLQQQQQGGCDNPFLVPQQQQGGYENPFLASPPSGLPPTGRPLGHSRSRSSSSGVLNALGATSSGLPKGGVDKGAQGAPLFADPSSSCKDALCVEVRLPPMHPLKDFQEPKLLATGQGNLFSLPCTPSHVMLNWADTQGHLGLPQSIIHAAMEDTDSTPCAAVPMPDPACEKATAVLVDELSSTMWTGHKKGRVCRWSIGKSFGARCEQVWSAHRDHKVRSMALTPWGELWTGSTYGTIRVWACSNLSMTGSTYGTIRVWACSNLSMTAARSPAKVCDVQRPSGVRPHSELFGMACSSSGRILWSVGRNVILLWDTYTAANLAANLGALRLSGEGPVGMDPEARLLWIDPAKGLDPSTLQRSFRMRPAPKGTPNDEDSSGEEDEEGSDMMKGDRAIAWQAKLTKGVGSVSKFAARMGKRTTALATSVPHRFSRHVRSRSNEAAALFEGGVDLLADGREASSNGMPRWGDVLRFNGLLADGREASSNGMPRWGDVLRFNGLLADGREASSNGMPRPDDSSQGRSKTAALLPSMDGHLILAFKSGIVERYTELGRRVWSVRATATQVRLHSAQLVGPLLWLGCSDGFLLLLEARTGKPAMNWRAHMYPVKSLAVMGTTVYSLAKDGSIRGWPAVQPSPAAHIDAWKEGCCNSLSHHSLRVVEGCRNSLRRHSLRVVVGSWNVNVTRPSQRSMYEWLGCHAADGADIVCVGLQEVEVGAGSVATDTMRSVLNRSALERGNANAQWWADQLLAALGGSELFSRVALRQMSGIVMVTFCRCGLVPHVGEVATSSVACGIMGVAGNKGAAAVSLSLYRRRLIFLSSHFAAHLDKVEERNADYAKIVRCLRFENTSATLPAKVSALGMPPTGFSEDDPWALEGADAVQQIAPLSAGNSAESHGPGLRDADAVIWVGDFNYRLAASYEWAVSQAEAGAYSELLAVDQLRYEMSRGTIFHGMSEGPLLFPPTYKFDKGVPGTEMRPLPYDSSDKKRVPAWTDRVFWRGSLPPVPVTAVPSSHEEDASMSLLQDGANTYASTGLGSLATSSGSGLLPGASRRRSSGTNTLGSLAYGAAMNVCDSDHKPVWCKLQLQLPAHVQQQKRRVSEQLLAHVQQQKRRVSEQILHTMWRETLPRSPPQLELHVESSQPEMSHTQVSEDMPTLVLKRDEVEEVVLGNPGPVPVFMTMVGGGKRLPLWLEVQPVFCLVLPHSCARISLPAAVWQQHGWFAHSTLLCLLPHATAAVHASRCQLLRGSNMAGLLTPPCCVSCPMPLQVQPVSCLVPPHSCVQPVSCLVPPRSCARISLQAAAPDGTTQVLGGAAALRSQKRFLPPQQSSETGDLFKRLMRESSFEQRDIFVMGKRHKQPRLTAYYATDLERGTFTYSGLLNIPSPFTPFLEHLKSSVQECVKEEFDSVLLNYYRDGSDTVGWHADNEKLYGDTPTIASLSFGSARDFILRKIEDNSDKYKFTLGPGDLLVMKGKTQQQWQHTVPRRSPPQAIGPRINLTFSMQDKCFPASQLCELWKLPCLHTSAEPIQPRTAPEPTTSKKKPHSQQSLLDPHAWKHKLRKLEQDRVHEQAELLQRAEVEQQAKQQQQQQQAVFSDQEQNQQQQAQQQQQQQDVPDVPSPSSSVDSR